MSRSLAGGRTRATTLAKWPRAFSRRCASCSEAPFWGPKTALAPLRPSSGESTSLAMTRSVPRRRSRAASRPAQVVLRDVGERQAAEREPVDRPDPEGREQAGAGVVGARAAETDDDAPRAGVERGEEQGADAERRRAGGVALVGREQVQPRRLRRLEVCRGAAVARRRAAASRAPPGRAGRSSRRPAPRRAGWRRARRRSPGRRRRAGCARARRAEPCGPSRRRSHRPPGRR